MDLIAMITLDRFFDLYERFAPPWLSDVLVTVLIVSPVLILI
jgi:hypothetical protein